MFTPKVDFIYSYMHTNTQSTVMNAMVNAPFSGLNFFGFISILEKYSLLAD
jgi:hypothetical protein